MCEHGGRASHNEGHDGLNIRPKQLRNREVPWEGSHGSKLMSRRTERPYQVDGAGERAPHSATRCSIPEINGPAVQRAFASLLREACCPSLSATAGTTASNGRRAGIGVSRGRSTESHEPETKKPEGLTTREGLNLTGRHDHRWSCPGAMKPMGRALGSDHCGRARVLLCPQGLSGTAGRGPACPVVWEAGGEIPPPTRLGSVMLPLL
jgi:hypothetical protein